MKLGKVGRGLVRSPLGKVTKKAVGKKAVGKKLVKAAKDAFAQASRPKVELDPSKIQKVRAALPVQTGPAPLKLPPVDLSTVQKVRADLPVQSTPAPVKLGPVDLSSVQKVRADFP